MLRAALPSLCQYCGRIGVYSAELDCWLHADGDATRLCVSEASANPCRDFLVSVANLEDTSNPQQALNDLRTRALEVLQS